MIYLLTASGLKSDGSSTAHIYTQNNTLNNTMKMKYTKQNTHNNKYT